MRLILNADDLGLSDAVNAAIDDAWSRGLVTDASLLATGPAFDDAVRRWRGREVGVHLDIAEFPPLTGWSGPRNEAALSIGRAHLPALVAEFEGQVRRVRATGLQVTHLDSHQHLHWVPVVAAAVREVRRRTDVLGVRGMGALPGVRLRRRAHAAAYNGRLRAAGATVPAQFGPAATVLEALHGGWRAPTVEAMLHPGGPGEPRYQEELDEVARTDWRAMGVSLVRWSGVG